MKSKRGNVKLELGHNLMLNLAATSRAMKRNVAQIRL
jgi:hypothetical protein